MQYLFRAFIGLTVLFILLVFNFQNLFAQEQEKEAFSHHKVALVLGHTHIPNAYQSTTGSQAVIVPSWGLNYDYLFNERWSIGVHFDMEIATYIIENADGSDLERERPVIISLIGTYKLHKGLMIGGGFGKEFEAHQNFWVYKFGVEYEFELSEQWGLAPSLVIDIKENLYHSWTIGLGVGRRF